MKRFMIWANKSFWLSYISISKKYKIGPVPVSYFKSMHCFNFSVVRQAINCYEWEKELKRTLHLYSPFSVCLLLLLIRASWPVVCCKLCIAVQGNLANSFCSCCFLMIFYMAVLNLANNYKCIYGCINKTVYPWLGL